MFAQLGVRKIRLTGGEPLVRADIVELVRRVAAVGGIEQVVMTTNGHLLSELAAPLAAAGLTGVNVSLDTLDVDALSRAHRAVAIWCASSPASPPRAPPVCR